MKKTRQNMESKFVEERKELIRSKNNETDNKIKILENEIFHMRSDHKNSSDTKDKKII